MVDLKRMRYLIRRYPMACLRAEQARIRALKLKRTISDAPRGGGSLNSTEEGLLYRVEAPKWVSLEYINGGVDPQNREFSPGSVLSFINTQTAWSEARALGKPLRYSFGRADREYKDRWCNRVAVYQV